MNEADDKPQALRPYSGPSPPQMHHRIPPETAHGLSNAPGAYDQPWRPYPPSFEHHHAEQRRASILPQPSLPSHGYPVIPNRELPQLLPEGSYGRPNSLPAPSLTPTESRPPTFRPMNGASHDPIPHSAPMHSAPPPPPPLPHSAHPDFRPRITYPPQEQSSNGDPPLPPPPAPHTMPPAQFPTPVPHIFPAPYEPNCYQNQAFGIRQRKVARAQQCRARKAKCDEGRPACSNCKENNSICVYKEVPPHKQEKATQHILDKIQYLEDKIDERLTHFQTVQMEHGMTLSKISNEVELKQPKILAVRNSSRSISPKQTLDKLLKPKAAALVLESVLMNGDGMQLLDSDEPPGQSYVERVDGGLSMPVEHSTAAHKLLSWPSIRYLLYPLEYDEDYVMKLEEQHGLIRAYGRGEGDDTNEDCTSPISLTSSVSSSECDDNYSHRASPSSPWAQSSQPSSFPQKLQDKGVDEFGTLMANPDTIRRYHRSYLEHIHKLHPFLDQGDLDKKMETFIKFYCLPKTSGSMPTGTGGLQQGAKRKRSCEALQGAACDFPTTAGVGTEATSRRIKMSIDNAVLLLVLALGSICEVGAPVPGPVTDNPPDFRKEWIPGPPTRSILSPAVSDVIFPAQGSSYEPQAASSPSPVDNRRGVRWRSASSNRDMAANRYLRNIDVIPGLSYYGYATQILGGLQGANGLLHVQAALLAGLYAGQLAHPFQSHGWIYQAARACQVLIRSKHYDQMQDGPMKELYEFAYWTCLQLESDILAELDLPASGISRAESRIGLPKGRFTLALPNEISAPSTMMMFFYSAQIYLRKVLNRVHTDLYKVERQQGSNNANPGSATNAAGSASAVNAAIAAITGNPSSKTTTTSNSSNYQWISNVQEILSMNLELWRNGLPEVMKWKDTDPPSNDINVARMRAKYYGARYIIHRPLLYHALHFAGLPNPNPACASVESPAGPVLSGSESRQVSPSLPRSQRASNMARLSSDMGIAVHSAPPSFQGGSMGTIAYRDLPPKLRRACKVCIDSAILSTEAFDGIKGRPIVTNIFGTAHAQFGNMLVLSATYMSCLSELVDRNVLEKLLKRTIKFLLQSRYISPSLRADARILAEIYEKIFGEPATRFSSAYN
ncbi:C6 finger domain protein, putative [Aspergillus udagawae]|nr:C6 finger domain protein, putative [Aspergillus udagawae]